MKSGYRAEALSEEKGLNRIQEENNIGL